MKSGIILLDKDAGMTSRDADNEVGRILGVKKIGHLGTLDPFATGLLIIGVDKGTKYLPYIDDSKKTYIASLKLGQSTSTGDLTGEPKETAEVPNLSKADIAAALRSFLGEGEQIPPMTSAIKVNGEELYKKAHRGEEVERKPRRILVHSINLISYIGQVIVFTCTVSQGTYIRVLGEDIAKKLGTVGHLTTLRRLAIGDILVEKSYKISSLSFASVTEPSQYIPFKRHQVSGEEKRRVMNGAPLETGEDFGERILVVSGEEPLAVYKRLGASGGHYVSERGLF
jgi:tRNA pseudouridine55 synthase